MASGEQLGRYLLVRKLATGGMAEVFLAKAKGPGGFEKSLVIKRMLPALAKDPHFVEMFLQEARLAAQFAHPAVVQIFDFGELDGQFFLAMEYIDGQNLRSIVRGAPERRLPVVVAARIIEQACEGLAHVHEFADASGTPLGLMHCDVSTDNLIIARNGAVKIIDFGVAKSAGQLSNAVPGTVRGKIAYMPPEQIIGEADLRADLYALGVILYEVATGTRPWDNLPDQQLLEAIITTDPVPLLARQPDLPPEFALIVGKAMARNPADRFQSGREMGAALEDFITSRGERIGPRQLAALAQLEESAPRPGGGATPVPATPSPLPSSPSGLSPRGAAKADPFAAFGVPVVTPTSSGSRPGPVSSPAPRPPMPERASALFNELFADLEEEPPAEPAPPPAPLRVVPLAAEPPRPPPAPEVVPPRPALPPPPVRTEAERRAAALLADATALRLYDAGALLGTQTELETARSELERDEGLHLLVRFPRHASRLLKALGNEALVSARVAGAVEGLLLAEAYGALATMLEHLQTRVAVDPLDRTIFEVAQASLATEAQATRLTRALREAVPSDVEGLGRVLPFFGASHAGLWLTLFESIELPASREAVLPGLAGLAGLNPAPFLERLEPKRPRRLIELSYCLERGRVAGRQRTFKELMARLDASRRKEVLTGLARTGSDDALRWLTQSLAEAEEEERVLASQLLGQHFPDRVFQVLGPLLHGPEIRSERERRAMWVAIGHSTEPKALEAIVVELRHPTSLLNRAKVEARKVDALEALAVMKGSAAAELMRTVSQDPTRGEAVRAAAQRHLRAAALIEQTTAEQAMVHSSEARRRERTPSTWRDVVLDLDSLASASRLVDLGSASFDLAFTRLARRLEALQPGQGPTTLTVGAGPLRVNGQPMVEGADPDLDAAVSRFQQRGIARFSFVHQAPRPELEQLARWLAGGAATEGLDTPSITRVLVAQGPSPAGAPGLTAPATADDSREAMIRYVDVVLLFRAWLAERQRHPAAPMPDVRAQLHELALLVANRRVRFVGVTPRANDRAAEVIHGANVMLLSLVFAAELGLSEARRVELASCAFFADLGNLDLKEETLQRAGRLTEEDQRDVAAARRRSAAYPFLRWGDARGAVSWGTVVVEQDVDWGTRETPGGVGVSAQVGLMGSLVALARAWETLTTSTATREGLSREAALEVLTTQVAHRFRPELLSLFLRFLKRQSTRAVAGV